MPMKKILFVFAASAMMMLSACVSDSFDLPKKIVYDSVNTDELTGIQHSIMVNIMTSKFGGYSKDNPKTRNSPEVTLSPYVEDGDTLLLIAQYPN